MKKKIRQILFSFITPFLIIVFIISISSLLINYLNNIQHKTILTMNNWQKLTSMSTERYRFVKTLPYNTFYNSILEFNDSIYELTEIIPTILINVKIYDDLQVSISFWEYIRTVLERNEKVYQQLLLTDLGKYLSTESYSNVLIDEYRENTRLKQFEEYSFYLISQLEIEYNVLINYIDNIAFYETKLQSITSYIDNLVDLIIKIIIVLSVIFSFLVLYYGIKHLKQKINEQQKRENYLSQILNSIGDAMIVLSEDQKIIRLNPYAESLLNISSNSVIGKKIYKTISFFREDSSILIDPISDVYISREMTIFPEDMIIKTKSGSDIYISSSASPFFDGKKLIGVAFVFKDITTRKKQEKELLQHKDNLEELVHLRTKRLEESITKLQIAQKQLVEAEKMSSLGELVAGVAHEINTPLGIALTSSSYIGDQVTSLNNLFNSNKLSKSSLISIIKNSTSTANLLQSNLMKASNIIQSFKQVAVDRSTEDSREFNVKNYIDEVLLSLKSEIRKSKVHISLQCNESMDILSYPGALSQILSHLILNSILHGFNDGHIGRINIDISRDKQQLIIHYSDTGIGIEKENLQKIYEPFYTTKRNIGKTGLGMNIVYNLVTQRLAGSIKCESTVGEGTHFYINFPLSPLN